MFDKAGIMLDRREMLKVKVKSLMEEAQIIRKEERKAKTGKCTQLLSELHEHRTRIVRRESRLTNIAYGFVRGHSLSRTEGPTRKNGLGLADWKKIYWMYLQYGQLGKREDEKKAVFLGLQGELPESP